VSWRFLFFVIANGILRFALRAIGFADVRFGILLTQSGESRNPVFLFVIPDAASRDPESAHVGARLHDQMPSMAKSSVVPFAMEPRTVPE
jgi:hypothetical protein